MNICVQVLVDIYAECRDFLCLVLYSICHAQAIVYIQYVVVKYLLNE